VDRVSPETIDGFVNAGLWLTDTVDTYGPGLTAAAIAWAGWWMHCRVVDYQARRREIAARRRQLADERQQMAHLRDAIDNAPLIPTQPGHDQQALDTCNAIYNLPARKENPQP
jgi:hypothetical protein